MINLENSKQDNKVLQIDELDSAMEIVDEAYQDIHKLMKSVNHSLP